MAEKDDKVRQRAPDEEDRPDPRAAQAKPRTFADSEVRPEPRKDDQGRPMIAPVTAATGHIPHEADGPPPEEDRPDRTVPGGRYQVGNHIVNANGEILEDAPQARKR